MRMGRPIPELVLTTEEQQTLERWARRPKSAQALAQRARLVLACAQGKSNTVVSREMKWTPQTVGKWRSRFMARRLDGLLDEPRPGDPLFVEKVRDIVGLYRNPPDRALVLCVDEKAPIQALNRTQPLLPMRPGQGGRGAHD